MSSLAMFNNNKLKSMSSKIDSSKLCFYNKALKEKEDGLIEDVQPLGFSVNYEEPGDGCQHESFNDDLDGALRFGKELAVSVSNERYADTEHYPSLQYNFVVTYNDGRKLYNFDTLISSRDARGGYFKL